MEAESNNKVSGLIVLILLFLIGMYFSLFRIMGFDLSMIPGDLADSRLNNYFLEHAHLFFTGKLNKYWDAPFIYPEPQIITYSDNLLGTFPIYSFFRLIGSDRETAYQLWIVVMFALNFCSAAFVLKKLTGNIGAAAIGAYIFAFSLPILSVQIYHAQVFPRFIIPFCFYWAFRFVETHKLKYFVACVTGVVFQLYAGIYLGLMLALGIAAYFIVHFLAVKRFTKWINGLGWRRVGAMIIILILSSLFLIPLLYPYYEQSLKSGVRSFDDVKGSIPLLSSYFFVSAGTFLWQFFESTAITIENWWDHLLFPGGLVILSLVAFIIIIKSPQKDFYLRNVIPFYFALILLLVFTVQVKGNSLYRLIYNIPGFSSMRSISRIINIELFLFALIVSFVFVWYYNRTKYKVLLLFGVAVFCVFDQYLSKEKIGVHNKYNSQLRVTKIKRKLTANNFEYYNAFAYMPEDKTDVSSYLQLDAMLASQDMGIPTVNGYTAVAPYEYGPFWGNYDPPSLHRWLLKNKTNIWKDKILIIQ